MRDQFNIILDFRDGKIHCENDGPKGWHISLTGKLGMLVSYLHAVGTYSFSNENDYMENRVRDLHTWSADDDFVFAAFMNLVGEEVLFIWPQFAKDDFLWALFDCMVHE